jgi:hypothetical protein
VWKLFGLALVLIIAAYLGYGIRAEVTAEARARELCEGVEIGAIYADVVAQAADIGEPRLRMNHDSDFTFGFTGMPPFSRHLRMVQGDGERVQSAE